MNRPAGQEVRVAMALNGGISLAIWMGGCAVELDAARRAHLGPESLLVPGHGGQDAPARSVYHALCAAFSRELSVDLMAGASAGGVNGALLGCASVHRRRLHPDFVRDRWLELGDLSQLLQRQSTADPRSLMQGDRFHDGLEEVFGVLAAVPGADPTGLALTALPTGQVDRLADHPPQPVPQLDVTATDLRGSEYVYRDAWDGDLVAREHRVRFAFRERDDYAVPALADAARSSASFPFAFEPWGVASTSAGLAGVDADRWFIDGGLLDNAPIRAVLDLIPDRPATRQVARYVCYLNADPPQAEPLPGSVRALAQAGDDDARPGLPRLLGAVVGLPRTAPFVDQVRAVEAATREAEQADHTERELLRASTEDLVRAADLLRPAYRRLRAELSLQELTGTAVAPGDVTPAIVDLLPWIPDADAWEPTATRWGWGIRPAQRALHLLADVLRRAIPAATPEDRVELQDARIAVEVQLQALVRTRDKLLARTDLGQTLVEVLADPADEVLRVEVHGAAGASEHVALAAVRAAVTAVARVADRLGPLPDAPATTWAQALFDGHRDDAAIDAFLRRALAIEVLRRATGTARDIDTAQRLRFVQLTPFTEVAALARPGGVGPASPEEKLAGIRLGHFAAFYRRSWRANDFMWGRLDASARIVDLLVDRDWAARGVDEPWTVLTDGLLPKSATDEQRWLVQEALDGGDGPLRDTAALRADLQDRLRVDLTGGGDAVFTRRVCSRAAQLEILTHELPHLRRASEDDAANGAGSGPLDLPAGTRAAIEALRPSAVPVPGALPQNDPNTLPRRLAARGRTEVGSDLALRTGAHAVVVLLAMLRTAGVPLSRQLAALRAAVLPIGALAARQSLHRGVAALVYLAAAAYLVARIVGMPESPDATVAEVTAKPALLGYVAVLVVLGVVAVPALRVFAAGWTVRALPQALAAIGLAAAGGLGVGALAALTRERTDWIDVLVGSGSEDALPGWLTTLLLALAVASPVGVTAAFRSRLGHDGQARRWAVRAGAVVALVVVALSIGELLADEQVADWLLTTSLASLGAAAVVSALYVRRGSRPG